MFVNLWHRYSRLNPRPSLVLSRRFTGPPDFAVVKDKNHVFYERIARKFPSQTMPSEAIGRVTDFLKNRGLSQTQALRVISQHIKILSYSVELMESKIPWFQKLGLSHDKINDIIRRHPNVLGISIAKYEALINWYLSHGVSKQKIAYLFNVFPQGVSYNVQDNLDPKVALLREIGCSKNQIARMLTRSPQIFSLSFERLRANADYLLELGVPRERLPFIISVAPECLALTSSRVKETVDALDGMFGAGTGLKALMSNCRIVMSNIKVMRESFDYLISVGFTKERLARNTRLITRNMNHFLYPRVQFLKSQNIDVVSDVTWILMSEGRFIERYPNYPAYSTQLKADIKNN